MVLIFPHSYGNTSKKPYSSCPVRPVADSRGLPGIPGRPGSKGEVGEGKVQSKENGKILQSISCVMTNKTPKLHMTSYLKRKNE